MKDIDIAEDHLLSLRDNGIFDLRSKIARKLNLMPTSLKHMTLALLLRASCRVKYH